MVALCRRIKNFTEIQKMGDRLNYDGSTNGATAKWIAPADSSHRIGLNASMKKGLILDGDTLSVHEITSRIRKVGHGFDYRETVN